MTSYTNKKSLEYCRSIFIFVAIMYLPPTIFVNSSTESTICHTLKFGTWNAFFFSWPTLFFFNLCRTVELVRFDELDWKGTRRHFLEIKDSIPGTSFTKKTFRLKMVICHGFISPNSFRYYSSKITNYWILCLKLVVKSGCWPNLI